MPGKHESPRDPAASPWRLSLLDALIARPSGPEPDAGSRGCWPSPAAWPAPHPERVSRRLRKRPR